MASSNPRRLQSQMVDALSCIICFLPYDEKSRLPKVFPCQHTVCQTCAEEMCQREYSLSFPCPTCRQPVPIPTQGASGLQTNLDVRNMVEIVQKTAHDQCSTANPNCQAHQNKTITNVCMKCEIGLCSRCFTSPSMMKNHSNHQILEIEEAFEKLKKTSDDSIEKRKKAYQLLDSECQVIQEKKIKIETYSTDFASACACKDLGAFGLLRKLSELLECTTDSEYQNLAATKNKISDNNCTKKELKRAIDSLDRGMSTIKRFKGTNTAHSIVCQKLAAVTFLIDLLRMNLEHNGVQDTLVDLGELCYESEACCSRVVMLGGADLLVSLFEASVTNEDLCCDVLIVYGRLSVFPSLHTCLVSSKAVNMLVYSLQNFTDQDYACKPLSFFLCNSSIKWPEECPSLEKVSKLVIDTCKKISLNCLVDSSATSCRPYISLLSQNVSEAAKYWAVLTLYWLIDQYPDLYCPILARDCGVTVLKQQSHAHEYVQRLAKEILEKFYKHYS